MKITDIKTFNVFAYRTNFVFVKLETDEGISGIGEGTLEYKENALLGAIEDIKRVLIGQDPREVERISHELYRDSYWRVGPVLQSAVSAVNMAMWDIKAKAAGVPVYEMLGGKVRDGVRMYANAWFAGAKTADEFAAAAVKAKNMGVTALKWDPFGKAYMYMENSDFRRSLEIVEAVRGAVGNDVDLLIEGHGRFDIATGIKIANALKPFDPYFFEEPTPPDCLDALAQVHKSSILSHRCATSWSAAARTSSSPTSATAAASLPSRRWPPCAKHTMWPSRRTTPAAPLRMPRRCISPRALRASASWRYALQTCHGARNLRMSASCSTRAISSSRRALASALR